MAQQTTVALVDDIDGSKGTETITFALDGAHYEIDLNSKNAKNLRKAFAEFVEHGRKVKTSEIAAARTTSSTRRKPASAAGIRTDKSELTAIRAWATENDIPVAARGRISSAVKEQYAARCAAA